MHPTTHFAMGAPMGDGNEPRSLALGMLGLILFAESNLQLESHGRKRKAACDLRFSFVCPAALFMCRAVASLHGRCPKPILQARPNLRALGRLPPGGCGRWGFPEAHATRTQGNFHSPPFGRRRWGFGIARATGAPRAQNLYRPSPVGRRPTRIAGLGCSPRGHTAVCKGRCNGPRWNGPWFVLLAHRLQKCERMGIHFGGRPQGACLFTIACARVHSHAYSHAQV